VFRHLGNSQWAQTPNGRGFDEYIGNYLWDLDTHTKQQYVLPWTPLTVDWVHAFGNGSYTHYAEPRHSTYATTQDAEDIMRRHAARSDKGEQPLFLYVAYTAAHSPLQPLPEHLIKCMHIPHLWRRQFCGMVVGLDEGIKNVTDTAREALGENTIVYVVSDNGGSTWFGGLNQPLHGSKATPFQGGILVPGFILDYTPDQRYIGDHRGISSDGTAKTNSRVREYHGMVHVSDILPTLMGYAGVHDIHRTVTGLDGFNFGPYLRSGKHESPRSEIFLDLYRKGDFIFPKEALRAYIMGDMKLIEGNIRDPHRYFESSEDRMNCSDPTIWTYVGEKVIRAIEAIFGAGQFDNSRITLTHRVFHNLAVHFGPPEPHLRLYNLTSDPYEQHNIAEAHPDIVARIRGRLSDYEAKLPVQQKFWMQYHLDDYWKGTLVEGDCSQNPTIKNCKFTHPWLPDDIDPWRDAESLTDSLVYADDLLRGVALKATAALSFFLVCTVLFCKKKTKTVIESKKKQ
jgi:arylsulfatase A-like enzyme